MTASKGDIERWLESAKEKGATHLIVAVDTYDHDNYPVYVGPNEKIQEKIQRIDSGNMQGIDEVYNMSIDIDKQLSEFRAWNL
ncbi:MAG: hypothetical protein ACTSRU_18085 [Candidatus Hodarchaeales archaeon]